MKIGEYRSSLAAENGGVDPYADMTDLELAASIHQTHYSDMPLQDFTSQVGVKYEPPQGGHGPVGKRALPVEDRTPMGAMDSAARETEAPSLPVDPRLAGAMRPAAEVAARDAREKEVLGRLPGEIADMTGGMYRQAANNIGRHLAETDANMAAARADSFANPKFPSDDPRVIANRQKAVKHSTEQATQSEMRAGRHQRHARYAGVDMENAIPEDAGWREKAAVQGVSSTLFTVPVLAASAAVPGGQPAALATLGASSGLNRKYELMEMGVPESAANLSGFYLGSLETLTEAIPTGTLLKRTPFFEKLAEFTLQDVLGENLSTAAEIADNYRLGLMEDVTSDDFLKAAKETTAATIVGAGANVSIAQLTQGIIDKANRIAMERRIPTLTDEVEIPTLGEEDIAMSVDEHGPGEEITLEGDGETLPGEMGIEEGGEHIELGADGLPIDDDDTQDPPPPGAPAEQSRKRINLATAKRRNSPEAAPSVEGYDVQESTNEDINYDDIPEPSFDETPKSAPERRAAMEEKKRSIKESLTVGTTTQGVSLVEGERGFYGVAVNGRVRAWVRNKDIASDLVDEAHAELEGMTSEQRQAAKAADVREYGDRPQTFAQQAHEAASSPKNDRQEPTPAQYEAGNYKKGHAKIHGLEISIENPIGSIRRSKPDSPVKWETKMKGGHYGYIRGTEDNTGEHVDVFVGPNRKVPRAYVIDQVIDGKFDEPKVILGAASEQHARKIYQGNYQKGWKGLGAITEMPIDQFQDWLRKGGPKQPLAWQPKGEKPAKRPKSILEYLSTRTMHGAKSTGLSIDAMVAEGLDPKELAGAKGHGINRPFTKNGGMSLDHAAELLAEAGYPVKVNGNYDKNKVLDLITAELRQGKRTTNDASFDWLNDDYEAPPSSITKTLEEEEADESIDAIAARETEGEEDVTELDDDIGTQAAQPVDWEANQREIDERDQGVLDNAKQQADAAKERRREEVEQEAVIRKIKRLAEGNKTQNTVFKQDDALKAFELLKKKLGQVNAGLDPEMVQAGIQAAGYIIESGARTFTAYAKAMIEVLGDAVRPYLKSWYMGVKYDPRSADFEGMSSAAEVEAANIGDVDATSELDSPSAAALEGAPSEGVPGDDQTGDARASAEESSRVDEPGDSTTGEPGSDARGSVGDDTRDAPVSTGGTGRKRRSSTKQRVQGDAPVQLGSEQDQPLDLFTREPTGGDQAKPQPYASGMSRKGDLQAVIESKAGAGVVITELSHAGMEAVVEAVQAGKPVFVDSGAFSAFKKAIKEGRQETIADFDTVMRRYDDLLLMLKQRTAYDTRNLVMFVSPDVVGDQEGTLELIQKHADRVTSWMEAGVEVVVPFQKGPLKQSEMYSRVAEILGGTDFVVGIPSNAEALSSEDLAELLRQPYKPARLHILGSINSRRMKHRLAVIQEAYVDDVPGITADANLMRSKMDRVNGLSGKDRIDAVRKLIGDSIGEPEPEALAPTLHEPPPPAFEPTDFEITDELALGEGGQKTKFKANIDAIRVLKQLDQEGRPATPAEQQTLAKYIGWGGIAQAFDESNDKWTKEYAELKELLTDEEYEDARRSTRYAHYTSREIIGGIYSALERMGFGGGKILEPGSGVGNFMGLMPASLRGSSRFTAVEREPIAAGISKHLYPKQNVQKVDFTEFQAQDSYFDAVIGNPPFASDSMLDKSGRKHLNSLSVHNYFFAKSVDLLRDNGILAMVVSNYFMDAKRDTARKYIAERTKFLGAIRLPNNAFSKNANTEVTTDIIFLQKRPESDWASMASKRDAQEWLDIGKLNTAAINGYFVAHPEMLLGDWGPHGTMYGPDQPALRARPGQDTTSLLNDAIAKLPEGIYTAPAIVGTEHAVDSAVVALKDKSVQEGGYYQDEGKLYQRLPDVAGEGKAIEITPDTKWTEKTTLGKAGFDRIKALSDLRVTMRGLIAAEMSNDEKAMKTLRKQLNNRYDNYVEKNGHINGTGTARVFDDDPDYPLLAALEMEYTPAIRENGKVVQKAKAVKSAIFKQRVIEYREPVTKAESPADALAISIAERGVIDPQYIGSLLGRDPDVVLEELAEGDTPLLFKDPATGEYVFRDAYLSGNVREKLKVARQANMFANVRELERVQPDDVGAHEIRARIGSPWVPTKVYQDFAVHLFGEGTKTSIQYVPLNSSYSVWIAAANETANKVTWGHPRFNGDEIITALLNNRELKVTNKDNDGKTYTDKDATEAVNIKAQEIKDKFQDWLFADPERSELLVRAYNDVNNNYVTRKFDGAFMRFPGKVPDSIIKFRRHQRNAIARIVQDRTALLDHVVGAGKTFTVVSAAMELKRMGLAKKPLVVVPNHLVKQWAADFYRLYPGAKVLTATKKDFERNNRRRFLARIATGDWDAVVMAHSSFGFIKPAPDFEADFNGREIKKIMETIESVKNGSSDERTKKRSVKQLEGIKERLENRIASLRDRPMDALLDFAQIGVDQLFVDEAHMFKNLMFTSKMRDVRGLGDQAGSQRAYDMYVKVNQVLEQNGRGQGVVFATGTPVSNSLAEMYHMMRYLMPGQMEQLGFTSFDAWANTFAEVEQVWAQKISADGYKATNTMANFVNTHELLKMFDQVSDTVTMDDIKRAYREENQGKEFPIPALKGGRRTPVSLVKTEALSAYMNTIAARARALEAKKGPPKKGEDNALVIMTDARKAAMDIRLVDIDRTEREPGGRVDAAAERITERYHQWAKYKGTQLVFSDMGTPLASAKDELKDYNKLKERIDAAADETVQQKANLGNEEAIALIEDAEKAQEELAGKGNDWLDAVKAALRGFSVYDDLKKALVERGIPADEIAFIHSYNTDDQKAGLFRDVNSGKIRVVVGSTPKMGAGTNVQERLVALHHLDVPWRPSDVEQREGRILRQGNKLSSEIPNFEVEILAYVTQDTLDMRMWQIQETKVKMINQLRTRQISREIENAFEDMEMSAGEMQAAATGNMDLLHEIKLRTDLKKLEQKKRAFDAQKNDLESRGRRAREQVASLPARIQAASAKAELGKQYTKSLESVGKDWSVTINGKTYTDAKEAGAILEGFIDAKETVKGKEKAAKLDVNFNGTHFANRTALTEAFNDTRPDRETIRWTFGGKDYVRRVPLLKELKQLVADAIAYQQIAELGSLGPLDIKIEGNDEKTAELTIEHNGTVLDSVDLRYLSTPDATEVTKDVIRAAHNAARNMEGTDSYLKYELQRAKKSLEELAGTKMADSWPDQDKLDAMRKAHQDVLKRLNAKPGDKPAEASTLPDDLAEVVPAGWGPVEVDVQFDKPRRGPKAAGVRKYIEGIYSAFKYRPPFTVVQSWEDLPARLQSKFPQSTRGVYSGGHVYYIADRFLNTERARATIFHETVAHFGLRALMDVPTHEALLDGIAKDNPMELKRQGNNAYGSKFDSKNKEHRYRAAEETIAHFIGPYLQDQSLPARLQRWLYSVAESARQVWARLMGRESPKDERFMRKLATDLERGLRQGKRFTKTSQISTSDMGKDFADRSPAFYSSLTYAAEMAKITKANAQQWMGTLKNTPGVKTEEIEWSGIEEWLGSLGRPATKDEVVAYLNSHEVEISEVIREEKPGEKKDLTRRDELNVRLTALGFTPHVDFDGSLTYISRNSDHKEFNYDPDTEEWALDDGDEVLEGEVAEVARELGWVIEEQQADEPAAPSRDGDGVRYARYTLPGGENYREMLLTLPRRTVMRNDWVVDDADGSPFGVYDTEEEAARQADRIGGRYEANVSTDQTSRAGNYWSSHWSEQNIVAHVRFNERKDADGKRVLFLEEMQSDWHQAGRDRGYRPQVIAPVTITNLEETQYGWRVTFSNGEQSTVGKGTVGSNATIAEVRLYYAGRLAEMSKDRERAASEKVPDAPFKTTWPELVFKRMLRWAAENGFERIAWTPGDVQNDRYSLDTFVRSIEWETVGPDSGWVDFIDKSGSSTRVHIARPSGKTIGTAFALGLNKAGVPLADIVGSEMANAILSSPRGMRHGMELRFGGEGMRGFYDNIMPKTVNKLVKRWGVKVGQTHLTDKSGMLANDDAAKAAAIGAAPVHSVDITPDMRSVVLDGQPMFELEQTAPMPRTQPKTTAKNPKALGPYGKMASRVIDAWNTKIGWRYGALGSLPGARQYLIERYRTLGGLSQVRDISRNIYDALAKANEQDAAGVYEYLTTRDATPDGIQDEKVRAMAVNVKETIDAQGQALVAAGLLSEESYETYRDQYLPRLYLRHVLDDSNQGASGGTGKKLTDQGYLKKRKDIPEEVRKVILGEITDGAFLSAFAISRVQRDLTIMNFLSTIASNSDWTPPMMLVEWDGRRVSPYWLQSEAKQLRKQADHLMKKPAVARDARAIADRMDTLANDAMEALGNIDLANYQQIPDSARYGALRGLYVRKEIHEDLVGAYNWVDNSNLTGFTGSLERAFGQGGLMTKATQAWKTSKVALNVPSHFRNMYGNAMMLHLSGIPGWRLPDRLLSAINSVIAKDEWFQIAAKYGIKEATFANTELYRIRDEWIRLQKTGKGLGSVKAMLGQVTDKIGDVYQFEEALFKIAKMRDAMEREGMSEADAMIEAHKWVFDYSLVPRWVRWMRNAPMGVPFLSYSYFVLPRLAEVAVRRPWKYLPYIATVYALQAALLADVGGDEEDLEKLKKSYPQWMQEKGGVMLYPYKDQHGRWQAVDMGYTVPWGGFVDSAVQASHGNMRQSADTLGLFSGPVPDLVVAYKTGIDPFTMKPIAHPGDPRGQQALSYLNYAWNMAIPGFLTEQGAIGIPYLAPGKIMQATGTMGGQQFNARTGEPGRTPTQATLGLFGVNVSPIDPEATRETNIYFMRKEVDEVRMRLKNKLRDKNLTEEDRKNVMKTYTDEIERLQQKVITYQEESQIPSHLRRSEEPRDLTSKVGPLLDGKTKMEAVQALKDAGYPALASLIEDMPAKPRRTVSESLASMRA